MENTKTKWEGQNRSFKGDLRFGKLCEDVIRRFLMHYVDVDDVRDISNSNRGIKDDIDFEIVYRDGHTSTAELKSDMQAHKTGNIAYEELSHKNPGCFARTKADHIIYYLTETGVAYVLNPHKLRAFVAEMKADERKAGGAYLEATGIVKKLDDFERLITMQDGTKIPMDDILTIESDAFSSLEQY